jgi:hypothetical protein
LKSLGLVSVAFYPNRAATYPHLKFGMIAGNPNAGRRFATVAIAIFLMMVVIAVLVGLSKRTAPLKEPPLHPSTIISVDVR